MNTIDTTLAGLKTVILEQARGALEGIPVYLRDDAEERDFPCIVLVESGAEEHPVLLGVLEIGVNVLICSVVVDEPEADDTQGTSPETHREISGEIETILRNELLPDMMTAFPNLKVWDCRGTVGITTGEDGMRITTFENKIIAARV